MDLDSPGTAITISGNEKKSFALDIRTGDRVFADLDAGPSFAFGIL